jgi:nesprin-1
VARIASDVGLEAGGLLEAEVDALGTRLEDVRESLATLVEAAESKVANKDLCTDDLLQTKSYLASVQQVRNKCYFIVF